MDAPAAIAHARRHSRYLARLLDARPALEDALRSTLQAQISAALLGEWLTQTPFGHGDEAALKSALRRLRAQTHSLRTRNLRYRSSSGVPRRVLRS